MDCTFSKFGVVAINMSEALEIILASWLFREAYKALHTKGSFRLPIRGLSVRAGPLLRGRVEAGIV